MKTVTTIKIPKFRSAKRAFSFATKYKTKLDDNSEKLIAKDAEYSWQYAEVIGSRFELGEPAIAKDSEASYYYAVRVIKGRFELGEPAIAKNHEYSSMYAEEIIKGRFELGEPAIANSIIKEINRWNQTAFQYSKEFCGGNFKLLESILLNDKSLDTAMTCARYALHIGKRFLEAEEIIAKNTEVSVYYAINVIKGRFEIAEENISKNEAHLEEYIVSTKQKLSGVIHNMMIARSLVNDRLAEFYFSNLENNKKTLKKLLQEYPEDMTVKEVLQN